MKTLKFSQHHLSHYLKQYLKQYGYWVIISFLTLLPLFIDVTHVMRQQPPFLLLNHAYAAADTPEATATTTTPTTTTLPPPQPVTEQPLVNLQLNSQTPNNTMPPPPQNGQNGQLPPNFNNNINNNFTNNDASSIQINLANSQNSTENTQYDLAIAEVQNGRVDHAIWVLREIPNLYRYRPAQILLITLLIETQQFAAAQEALNTALKAAPKDSVYIELQGNLLARQGEVQKAIILLKANAPQTVTENPDYFGLLASLLLQTDDYNGAKSIYLELIKENGGNALWWAGLGVALKGLGDNTAAQDALLQASNIGHLPTNLQFYINNQLPLSFK